MCKNCGETISDDQYSMHNGLCPACKRLKPFEKSINGEGIFLGIIMLLSGIFIPIMEYLNHEMNSDIFIIFASAIAVIGLITLITNLRKK